MHDKIISTVKFIAHINIKFLKCFRTKCLFSWLLKTLKPNTAILVFYKDQATSFNTLNQTKWCILFFSRISFWLKKKKKRWMPQNKVGESTSCTHWWEKQHLTLFYILDLFQTITANVVIEKKNQQWCTFWGSYMQRLQVNIMNSSIYITCGSCHDVSRNM